MLVRGQVRGKLGQRLDTVVECLKVRVRRENSRVLSQHVHRLDLLPKDEVDKGKLIASQILLLAKEVGELLEVSDTIVSDFAAVITLEHLWEPFAASLDELLLNLKDASALLRVVTNEVRCELVTDVGRHTLGLSDVEVAILDVRNVWEVHAEIDLVFSPLLTVVSLVFEVNTTPGEAVPVDVTTVGTADGPVCEDGLVLCHLKIS